jgi:ATP-binding cassette subfamily F protein 3
VLGGQRTLSSETRIGYFAQHQLDLLDPELSPYGHLQPYAAGARESELRNYLGRFGFNGERIFEPVAPFSGGEKARLVLALLIYQQPNLLLLDEPTNHLDLEMRQALSRALIGYGGALLVISHDRHLLRSVCDDLLIVSDGTVERFDLSLDEYPAWLKEQASANANAVDSKPAGDEAVAANRKQQRKSAARRRQQLKPLTDRVRKVESSLAASRRKLEALETRLSDTSLYSEPAKKSELTSLIQDQANIKADIETLEWEWFQASENLERAQNGE